ncbi:glycerol kinase GlpK [Occallatibacter riparius]|uniref:Glycerol kinase n=1 Tax=Occallatibacter riparius TaxID=1002689 RepID=A0A9J7BR59_9BACT|nr:glycerol kinase GlpK [Occallatibacter riparius]UWZ85065.1 glycerol kinase GlpK [Occallatibacter riparius]
MSYVLALDQGTTSSRAILFDQAGNIAAVAQKEFQQFYPQAGWVEHDPMEILTSQMTCAVEVLGKVGARPRDVAAIGITNQRETVIVWERETGHPIHPAIVWQDRRTAGFCSELEQSGAGDNISNRSGLVIDPYFSATKIRWILDNVPGARARAERGELAFGTVDSWLVWHLTSGHRHVTDVTNASRTLLFNVVEGRWDPELLRIFGIPESMLPDVAWSSERVGEVTTTLGLGGISIAGIAGDQQAALFGQLCWNPGDAKNTYGTGCFLLQNIGTNFMRSKYKLITTIAASAQHRLEYAFEGSVFIGGAVVQWLRDNLRIIGSSAEVGALAAGEKDAGGLIFVPAFVGLGAPHWDPHASGLLIGLRRDTRPGHIARAALESIAFQVADVLEAMDSETPQPLAALRVDGGAAVNDLLMQFQADVLGVPVVRPQVTETTALGAAYLAGLAVGFWHSPEDLRSSRKADTRFEPKMDRAEATRLRARWHQAVERSKNWAE